MAVECGEVVALADGVALLAGDVGETVIFHAFGINELKYINCLIVKRIVVGCRDKGEVGLI